MAAARKRPRDIDEANRAECPFSARLINPKEREQKKKKRRRGTENADDGATIIPKQLSPFAPTGKFKTYETMDVHYQVEPMKAWQEMTRYNSFVCMSWVASQFTTCKSRARF